MADIENRADQVEKAPSSEASTPFSAHDLMGDTSAMRPSAMDVPKDIAGTSDLQLVSQGFRTNWATDGGATPAEARMAVNSQPGAMTQTRAAMLSNLATLNA